MTEIQPFRGLFYNISKIKDFNRVITPPYDVIEPAQLDEFQSRSPYNMIHLILGMRCEEECATDEIYNRAGSLFKDWLEKGILFRNSKPAIYFYEIDYKLSPTITRTRKGFISLLKLEEFGAGSVRPHEKTYEATKSERLKLMCCCNANLSQIFALYSDPADVVMHYLQKGREESKIMEFTDECGISHRLWRVTDREVIRKVQVSMRDKAVFIADGHHRYETALNYKRLMQERFPEKNEKASFNYVMIYLANMDHAGVTILPTHRMLKTVPDFSIKEFITRASEYFSIEEFPFSSSNKSAVTDQFLQKLAKGGVTTREYSAGVFGYYLRGLDKYLLFRGRKEKIRPFLEQKGLPEQLLELDVVILTHLFLKHVLGISGEFLNDETRMWYEHDSLKALHLVEQGEYHMTFLINPTRIEQVRAVASAGLIMPHKATYFYPKVITGTAINIIDPDEIIDF